MPLMKNMTKSPPTLARATHSATDLLAQAIQVEVKPPGWSDNAEKLMQSVQFGDRPLLIRPYLSGALTRPSQTLRSTAYKRSETLNSKHRTL